MTRRFDAVQNDERIIDAALHTLAADPTAGMERVAAAAGVGRATLYRRFPSRDDLVTALREEARREAKRAMRAARPDEGSPAEAIGRLVRELLATADRYAFLTRLTEPRSVPDPALARPWLKLIKRGQERGDFARDVAPEWWLGVIRAHFHQARQAIATGVSVEEAAQLVTRSLLGGLAGYSSAIE